MLHYVKVLTLVTSANFLPGKVIFLHPDVSPCIFAGWYRTCNDVKIPFSSLLIVQQSFTGIWRGECHLEHDNILLWNWQEFPDGNIQAPTINDHVILLSWKHRGKTYFPTINFVKSWYKIFLLKCHIFYTCWPIEHVICSQLCLITGTTW